jgi:hypothetical protein
MKKHFWSDPKQFGTGPKLFGLMAKLSFKTIFFTELKQIGPVQNYFGPMEGHVINQ